jgi:hypothetical protein
MTHQRTTGFTTMPQKPPLTALLVQLKPHLACHRGPAGPHRSFHQLKSSYTAGPSRICLEALGATKKCPAIRTALTKSSKRTQLGDTQIAASTSTRSLPHIARGAAKKKMTKVTYICRSAKKKVVTYFILFLFLFLFFIDFFVRRFWAFR